MMTITLIGSTLSRNPIKMFAGGSLINPYSTNSLLQ